MRTFSSLKIISSIGEINISESSVDIANITSERCPIVCSDIILSNLKIISNRSDIGIGYSSSASSEIIADIVSDRGDINFAPPPGFTGQIDLAVESGTIETDLPISIEGEISNKRIKGTIGQGNGKLHIENHRGSIKIVGNTVFTKDENKKERG
ncbi:MAG: DUF4097 family beta strand repeat protein, partial [Planctomycetes bacterium]|nr:DUF4097 family beta strand repeat protein [Planctomycetota bacterium]